MRNARMWRKARAAVAMVVSAVAALGLCVPAAVADDNTGDLYWYVDSMGVRDAWKDGVTGEGVTVAIIDEPIVSDYPGFSGQDVEPRLLVADGETSCTAQTSGGDVTLSTDQPALLSGRTYGITVTHGTGMAALIVGNGHGYDGNPGVLGVAPKAKVLSYVGTVAPPGPIGEVTPAFCKNSQDKSARTSLNIRDAVDAGARVVSMSYVNGYVNDEDVADYVYALSHGVIMVSARDNQDLPGADDLVGEPTKNNYFPGVVTVNAVDRDGNLSVLSDTKDGNVSILSPGVGAVRYEQTSDREVAKGDGTSVSAAVLNGYLALVLQKWPDATGNQVLQSLVRNTKENASGEAELDAEHKRGFGQVDLTKLLSVDPTQYPDVNPLLEQVMQRSEAHKETQGMYTDHSDWEDGTWRYSDKFPYEIRATKSADLVGKEYERQKAAWEKVEACRAEGGADCMQYSATATAVKTDADAGSSDASISSSNSRTVPVVAWVAIGVGVLLLIATGVVLVVMLTRRRKGIGHQAVLDFSVPSSRRN